jgi:hypothetical protein
MKSLAVEYMLGTYYGEAVNVPEAELVSAESGA